MNSGLCVTLDAVARHQAGARNTPKLADCGGIHGKRVYETTTGSIKQLFITPYSVYLITRMKVKSSYITNIEKHVCRAQKLSLIFFKVYDLDLQ